VNLTNARLSYEPHRGDGAVCIYFKDIKEAVGLAEAILQEVKSIENDGLSIEECALVTVEFADAPPLPIREMFRKDRYAFITVPDRS
jgi:hypothetical protein